MPRQQRSAEELEKILLTKAAWDPGEEVTFRTFLHPRNPGRIGIKDIQAGDHPPSVRDTIYPFWISPKEFDILLERCKKVSNFYIYEPIS